MIQHATFEFQIAPRNTEDTCHLFELHEKIMDNSRAVSCTSVYEVLEQLGVLDEIGCSEDVEDLRNFGWDGAIPETGFMVWMNFRDNAFVIKFKAAKFCEEE